MKRVNNPTTYEIETERGRYAVSMERGKNTNAGCPRFTATLIVLDIKGQKHYFGSFFTVRYTFNGHYLDEHTEAVEVVKYFEQNEEV